MGIPPVTIRLLVIIMVSAAELTPISLPEVPQNFETLDCSLKEVLQREKIPQDILNAVLPQIGISLETRAMDVHRGDTDARGDLYLSVSCGKAGSFNIYPSGELAAFARMSLRDDQEKVNANEEIRDGEVSREQAVAVSNRLLVSLRVDSRFTIEDASAFKIEDGAGVCSV